MLNIISKIIAAVGLVISSYVITKRIIIGNKRYVFNFIDILMLIGFVVITVVLHNTTYSPFSPIASFLLMIIIYKTMFSVKLSRITLVAGLVMIIYFIADILTALIFLSFVSLDVLRTNPIIIILSNLLVCAFAIGASRIKPLISIFNKFIETMERKKYYDKVVFIGLMIIILSFIAYNITSSVTLSKGYIINVILMFIFFLVAFLFIIDRLKKEKLDYEYNQLMQYVDNFENWIDEEQMNKHEYKNQLAVIRTMIQNNKQATEYIDKILNNDMYLEDFWANEIKYLPSGGIKGLLYYKLILTKKENIDICLSVSRDIKNVISNVDGEQLKNISTVLGIYLDNAIEAAKESKNKLISIEIYPINTKIIIAISNTYKGEIDMKKVNKKGYTTKGKGHGRGLYFAQKIIKKSSNLESESHLINNYYVQKLIIKNI